MLRKYLFPLLTLRAHFVAEGFDVRVVGGAVRDVLLGLIPKDIDLCTNAAPEQQIAIYEKYGYRYIETGLKHGTITVMIDGEAIEITSLRLESDHDGRHATITYTSDWNADLGRRDLTINAMAMDFDGNLYDPFGGKDDLENLRVRFVGDPDARMREDYLRILRWIRFHARIAHFEDLDPDTVMAAKRNAEGLAGISRERIWSEMSKILIGNTAMLMLEEIYAMGLSDFMGLPQETYRKGAGLGYAFVPQEQYTTAIRATGSSTNPVTILTAFLGPNAAVMPTRWKWSSEERDLCLFLVKHANDLAQWKTFLTVGKKPKEWLIELAAIAGDQNLQTVIKNWDIPVFPLKGQDLVDQKGMPQSPAIGKALNVLKDQWVASDFQMTKEDLLATI